MKTLIIAIVLIAAAPFTGLAQQSDFALKKGFEDRYKSIVNGLDSATTLEQLDSLKKDINALQYYATGREAFLDKALYPSTLDESITRLNTLHVITYDRVYLINTQGIKLSDLESKLNVLTSRLDSLTAQRDQLFGELQESKKSIATLREAVKRLSANLQAKDKLIFALVDTIFLPYGNDVNRVADIQKEAISQKLGKANVLTRVYEIAADNAKFLDVTQLQGKDYASIIDQYLTFKSRWSGLKEKMAAVAATNPVPAPPAGSTPKSGGTKGGSKEPNAPPAGATTQAEHVDSVLAEWQSKLSSSFWGGLAKEFSSNGIGVAPFHDGPSFSASIRNYVATLKANKQDPSPFVENVWKARIDKEWRDALTRESMLGKTEYASLDLLVSDLSKGSVDMKLILYIAGILAIVFAVWFFVFRKRKTGPLSTGT